MGWYQKLNDYFPENEMKKKEQLEALIADHPHYKKVETKEYIVLYAEYDDFIFVDYILVDRQARGQGIGSTILEKLQQKGKTIILEVEPVVKDDPETVKREQFYVQNGFQKAKHIRYYRDVGETSPELNQLELYYWSPDQTTDEEEIRQAMLKVYEDVHNYQYDQFFERKTPNAKDLIRFSMQEPEHSPDEPGIE